MRLGLPKPDPYPETLREEFKQFLVHLKVYRAAELPSDVSRIIHAVAMDRSVSDKVVQKLKSDLTPARERYFKICLTGSITVALNFPIMILVGVFLGSYKSNEIVYAIWITVWLLTIQYFMMANSDWRARYRDYYLASYLIRALEFGLRYREALADDRLRYNDRLRDGFAESIQRSAVRYPMVYKRSTSTRYFAAQVRARAKRCRNDIMSLIPSLVTASQSEVDAINEALARLIIRSQTGYWYQTGDIVRREMPLPRKDAVKLSVTSFIRDRSIQVAMVALTATLIGAILTLVSALLA